MKWKSIILGLLAALSLGLCLWSHFGRVNKEPVYVKKIEKDSGFKAMFDKKKGTLTIIKAPENSQVSKRTGDKRPADGDSDEVIKVPRRATIDYDEHSKVLKVFAPKSGFVFEPGMSGVYSTVQQFRLGLDVQFFFYQRWGIVGGVSGATSQRISPALYIGATWQPSQKYFTNTSLLLGIDNRKDWYLGIRIGL